MGSGASRPSISAVAATMVRTRRVSLGRRTSSQRAMAGVNALGLRKQRIGRLAFACAGIRVRRIEQNVVKSVDGLLCVYRQKPYVAKAGYAIDQQSAIVVDGRRFARQDTARGMQRLTSRIDASVRAGQNVSDGEHGTV